MTWLAGNAGARGRVVERIVILARAFGFRSRAGLFFEQHDPSSSFLRTQDGPEPPVRMGRAGRRYT
jgi:hypothetical protein